MLTRRGRAARTSGRVFAATLAPPRQSPQDRGVGTFGFLPPTLPLLLPLIFAASRQSQTLRPAVSSSNLPVQLPVRDARRDGRHALFRRQRFLLSPLKVLARLRTHRAAPKTSALLRVLLQPELALEQLGVLIGLRFSQFFPLRLLPGKGKL